MIRRALLAAALALAAGTAAADEERMLRLDRGLVLALPEGWTSEDGEETEDGDWDATALSRVRLACKTQACEKTREACYLTLRSTAVEGADDAARLAGLYASPVARYSRLRTVLRIAGDGSSIGRPLALAAIGKRSWWVVETRMPAEDQFGLFAETVVDGRPVQAVCKSREGGTPRHEGARALLSTLRGPIGP